MCIHEQYKKDRICHITTATRSSQVSSQSTSLTPSPSIHFAVQIQKRLSSHLFFYFREQQKHKNEIRQDERHKREREKKVNLMAAKNTS